MQDSSDATEVSKFMSQFQKSAAKWETDFQKDLEKYPNTLATHYKNLVPSQVSHKTFVQRYFYRCCDEERILKELEAASIGESGNEHDETNDGDDQQGSDTIMQLRKRNVGTRSGSQRNVQRSGSDRFSPGSPSGNQRRNRPLRSASSDDPEAAAVAAAVAAKFGGVGPGRPASSNAIAMPPSALKKPSAMSRNKRTMSDQVVANGTSAERSGDNVHPQRGSTGALVRFRGVPEAEPVRRAAWESEESHIKKMHTDSAVAPPTPFQRQESLVGTDSLQRTILSSLGDRSGGLSDDFDDENDSTDALDSPPSLAAIRQQKKEKAIKSVLKQAVDPTKPPTEPSRPGWNVRERPQRPTTGIPVIPKRHTSADHSGHSQRSAHSISMSAHSRGSSRASFGSESLLESDTEHTEYDNEDDESATIPSVDLSRETSSASIEDAMRMWGAAMKGKKVVGANNNASTTSTNTSGATTTRPQGSLLDGGDDEARETAKPIPMPVSFAPGNGSEAKKRPSSSSIDTFDSIDERSDESGSGEEGQERQDNFSGNTPAAWKEAFSKKKGSQRRLSYSETDEETEGSSSGPPVAWKTALKPSKKNTSKEQDAPWKSAKLRSPAPNSPIPRAVSHESAINDGGKGIPTRIKSTSSLGSAESLDGSQDSRKQSAPSLDAYFNRRANEALDSSEVGSSGSVSERLKMWAAHSEGVHPPSKDKPTIIVPLKDKVKKYGTPSNYPKRNSSNDSLLSYETNASAGSLASNIHFQLAVQSVAQVDTMRNKPETYTTALDTAEMTMDDSRAYRELVGRYDPSRKEDDIQIALAKYPDSVAVQYMNLVPDKISRDDFWLRYFFRCDEKRVLRALRRKEASGRRPPDIVELGGEKASGEASAFPHYQDRRDSRQTGLIHAKQPDSADDLDLSTHTSESAASVKDRMKAYAAKISNPPDDSSSSEVFSSPRGSLRFSWKPSTPNKPMFESPGFGSVQESRKAFDSKSLTDVVPPVVAAGESDSKSGGGTRHSAVHAIPGPQGPPVMARRRSSESWIKSPQETDKEPQNNMSNLPGRTKGNEESSVDSGGANHKSSSTGDASWIKLKD